MRYIILFLFSINIFAQKSNKNIKTAYFASGCFWCVEAIYEHVPGVVDVISGYAGSLKKNPTYKTIKQTGHAETVAVYYNSKKINYRDLLDVYYASQDPTTFGQNPDYGQNYRSIIFYNNEQEKNWAWDKFKIINKVYNGKAITQIKPIDQFYPAEDYHQDFEKRNPQHPYIQAISIPRLNRFKSKYFKK